MNGEIVSSLRRELRDPEYSEGYAESFLNSFVATQIKVIREQREMTQAQLAHAIGTTQAGVSRIENVNYSSWSIRTLIKVARAFGVRLKVSFETFGTLPEEAVNFDRKALERVKREEDPGLQTTPDSETLEEMVGKYLSPPPPPRPAPVRIDSHSEYWKNLQRIDQEKVDQEVLGGAYATGGNC